MKESQRVIEFLLAEEIKAGKVELVPVLGMSIED